MQVQAETPGVPAEKLNTSVPAVSGDSTVSRVFSVIEGEATDLARGLLYQSASGSNEVSAGRQR